jgi:hypothetical protein
MNHPVKTQDLNCNFSNYIVVQSQVLLSNNHELTTSIWHEVKNISIPTDSSNQIAQVLHNIYIPPTGNPAI